MAIQNRRGDYANFDPQKMKPGEFAIVQSNDPNASDGKAVYICTQAGTVKRLVSDLEVYDEVQNAATEIAQEIHEAVDEDVQRAEAAAESIEDNAAQIAKNKNDISGLKTKTNLTENEIIKTAGVLEELECGLTEDVKTALLACFNQVAWIGPDGQTYYDALEAALNASRNLNSISVSFNQGSTVVYDTDELYGLKQYLTVTAAYDNGTTREVDNYTLNGTLTAGISTITVGYNKKSTTFNVNVTHQDETLESITATFNSSASITTDNVLDDLRPYLTVRALYSDGTTETVSNYTLSGNLNAGTNTITVTYSGKTATFAVYVTETVVVLQSITANFNQGSAVIYTNNTLNDLKQYLTVTGFYTDGTSEQITDYALSGTLTTGTSTITVTKDNKVATFEVAVTQEPGVLYYLPSITEFDGVDDYIDTGLQLMKTEQNFTIVADFNEDNGVLGLDETVTLFHCMLEDSVNYVYPGTSCHFVGSNNGSIVKLVQFSYNYNTSASSSYKSVFHSFSNNVSLGNIRIACSIDTDTNIMTVCMRVNGELVINQSVSGIKFASVDETLLIGAYRTSDDIKGRFFKGTINEFKVYDHAFSNNECVAYVTEV